MASSQFVQDNVVDGLSIFSGNLEASLQSNTIVLGTVPL